MNQLAPLRVTPANDWSRQVVDLILQDDLAGAIDLCHASHQETPGNARVMTLLGLVAFLAGNLGEATRLVAAAHDIDSRDGANPAVLSVFYALAGEITDCLYYTKLSTAMPVDPAMAELIAAKLPDFTTVFLNMRDKPLMVEGQRAMARRDFTAAASAFAQHLIFQTRSVEALAGLAEAQAAMGVDAQAADTLRALRHLEPADGRHTVSLGSALVRLGKVADGLACHRDAVRANPGDADAAAALVRNSIYDPGASADGIAALTQAWAAQFADSIPPMRQPANASSGKIAIGYLCAGASPADIGMLATVARAHDRDRFRVRGYGLGGLADARNISLREVLDDWYDCTGLDAATLAAVIAGDRVDILVDIGGFAAPTQLLAVAHRPARCQVAWLGQAHGGGLEQFDFVLADKHLDPDQRGALRQLPDGIWVYPTPDAPGIERAEGPVRFGAELPLAALDGALLASWSAILRALPNSRLTLRGNSFVAGDVANWLIERFANFGISDRIEVDPTGDFHRDIDIYLAPFVAADPHAAAAALAAGKPVVSLAGNGRHRRTVAALALRLGLGDWVGDNADDYVAKALAVADDPDAARARLARAVAAAATFRPADFIAQYENALHEMFQASTAKAVDAKTPPANPRR